ncbi:superoxide dismutase [Candidatus Amesbacteria bacterium RIFCSPHIGHO2_01_FULL_48_32]|uniref:Superoxide dismutase n=1 Tax=Candidatus Amesbacteria bacterium RIFCSPLOWO2_01_FULL_48_25 TaxID=1797259 RepID=A0A1F4ZCN6_9BACT|nr:MAG: superoxide dismutase [Candidatus Amesbacteria bacterium RIFCSPHIGHO2_01_FULL_48_32]OGD04072.1 MAG: superoxide dismutase [Candidatus Amesbacteria bacterium RIFCSPLOWO2_01_FULL_48_25]HJZ05663.1 superoxide dismutase [Patescibacteria group bacterium]
MFILPDLPYPSDALEPYIDKTTMEIHHGKHHAAYVDNLNKALAGNDKLLNLPVEELLKNLDQVPEGSRQAVINHGGGHANHSFFWTIMSPKSPPPFGKLLEAINSTFGNIDKFKEAFTAKAMSVFGSGWAFLIKKPDGTLSLKRHSFQNSPLIHGNTPILGLDVWEHAYYLKYQNRRAEYITAWWNIVNWHAVSENFSRVQV